MPTDSLDRPALFEPDRLPVAFERVAHELRTPLTSIRSAGEILRDYDLSPEDRKRFADALLEDHAKLHDLLEELLRMGTKLRLFC